MRAGPLATARLALPFALLAAGAGSVPAVPFESPGGLVIVRAEARGHDAARARVLHLLLDTGDPGGVTLTAAAARALGLSAGPPRPGVARGMNGPSAIARRSARLDSLSLDGVTWRDLPIDVVEGARTLPEEPGSAIDGAVGVDLLRDRRLTIDYPARRLTIASEGAAATGDADATTASGGPTAPPGDVTVGLRLLEGRLLTSIRAGGKIFPAWIDTASGRSLIERGAGLESEAAGVARLVDAVGSARSFPAIRVTGLAAGGAAIEWADLLEVDLARSLTGILPGGSPPPGAILGADLLSRYRVVIDPAAGRFILETAPGPSPRPPAPDRAAPDAARPPARRRGSGARSAGRRRTGSL